MKWNPKFTAWLFAAAFAISCASPQVADDASSPPADDEPVEVRILGANDIHGALQGPNGEVSVDGQSVEVGGLAYLATHVEQLREESEHTTFVHAGDLIGASPLISALFHDEPTILAMNLIGLDIAGVGNHEFDQGVDELLRIVDGGCHPDEGCRDGYHYDGVQFDYLAANVRYNDTDETILPPYSIREYNGVKIGYLGMTLEDTPEVVVPSAIEDVTFDNEIETIERYLPELNEEGVDTVVVVLHHGSGKQSGDINECDGVEGRIVDIAEDVPDEVSVIVSGHSHVPYVCHFNDTLVTQAAHSGQILTTIDLTFDGATRELLDSSARQHPVTDDVEPDPEVASLVDEYAALAEDEAQRKVGEITEDLSRGERSQAGTSPMGRLIADAQLEATADEAGADLAMMNPGGVRDEIPYDAGEPGVVTFEQLHTVQPFANLLITMTLTGQQIHDVLEQQWSDEGRDHLLAVSAGFGYAYNPEAPLGERVDFDSITLGGEPLQRDAEYRVTVNNFMADGGDGFTVFTDGTDRTGGMVDLDALAAYVERHSPIAPPDDERIQRLDD